MTKGLITLTEARQAYYDHSGKASDVARQLGFAGIAIIWIFKTDVHGAPSLGIEFIPATGWCIATLGADLLQYVCATAAWGGYARWKERDPAIDADSDFDAPRWLNWPGNAFFFAKLVCVAIAYWALSSQVWKVFEHHEASARGDAVSTERAASQERRDQHKRRASRTAPPIAVDANVRRLSGDDREGERRPSRPLQAGV
jgi:hypothetical protein